MSELSIGAYRVVVTGQSLSYSSEGLGDPQGSSGAPFAARLIPFSGNRVMLAFVSHFTTAYPDADNPEWFNDRRLGLVAYDINRTTGQLTKVGDVVYIDPSDHGLALNDDDESNIAARALGDQAILALHDGSVFSFWLLGFSGSTPVVEDVLQGDTVEDLDADFAEHVAPIDHSTGLYLVHASSPVGGGVERNVIIVDVRLEAGSLVKETFNHGLAEFGGEQAAAALHRSGRFAYVLWDADFGDAVVYPWLRVVTGIKGQAGVTITSFNLTADFPDETQPTFTGLSKDNHLGWFEDGDDLILEASGYVHNTSGNPLYQAIAHAGVRVDSAGLVSLNSVEVVEEVPGHPPVVFRPSDTNIGRQPMVLWGRGATQALGAALVGAGQPWTAQLIDTPEDDSLRSPAMTWSHDAQYAPFVALESTGYLRVGMVEVAAAPNAEARRRGQRAVFSR